MSGSSLVRVCALFQWPYCCCRVIGSRKTYTLGFVYQLEEQENYLLAVYDATEREIVNQSMQAVDWSKSSMFKTADKDKVAAMHFKLLQWVFKQFGCDPPSSCDCGCGQGRGFKRKVSTKSATTRRPKATAPFARVRKKQTRAKVVKAAIHTGIECDNCSVTPIQGLRYKCSICQEYDLCEECEKEGSHGHNEDHSMIAVSYPELPAASGPGKPNPAVLDTVAEKVASTKMLADAKLEFAEASRLQAEVKRMKLKAKEQEKVKQKEKEEAQETEKEEAEEKEQKREAVDKLAKKLEAKARRKAAREEAARKILTDSEDDESTADEEAATTTKGVKRKQARGNHRLRLELAQRELRVHKEMAELTYQRNMAAAVSRIFADNRS